LIISTAVFLQRIENAAMTKIAAINSTEEKAIRNSI